MDHEDHAAGFRDYGGLRTTLLQFAGIDREIAAITAIAASSRPGQRGFRGRIPRESP